jgi:hypothetical protein
MSKPERAGPAQAKGVRLSLIDDSAVLNIVTMRS